MYLPLKILQTLTVVFVISVVFGDDSFENVSIILTSPVDDDFQLIEISSSQSLENNIPDQPGHEVSVLNGSIPILYENSVRNFHRLRTISLSGVDLEEIQPNAFRNLVLKNLNLFDNKLKILQARTFGNVSVQSLNLFGNKLKIIAPGVLTSITRLTQLTLSSNQLEEIDPEVFNNPTLAFIDLQLNSISTLRPGDLDNLPQLKLLDLTSNKLQEIPEGVFNGTRITNLKFADNRITTIAPKAFDHMLYLTSINLDYNKLSRWDNNWLYNTPKLDFLHVSYNFIDAIPNEAFKNFPKVYTVELRGNKIKNIAPGALETSKKIVKLELSDNLIDSWEEDFLSNAVVGSVNLNNNKIRCIDGDLNTVFKQVYSTVFLWGNPWDSDCPVKTNYFNALNTPNSYLRYSSGK